MRLRRSGIPVTTTPSDIEGVEAEVRRLMAKHAGIAPRGWTSSEQRAVIHRMIDAQLDVHKVLAEIAALDFDPAPVAPPEYTD